jgi:hypothetical protein
MIWPLLLAGALQVGSVAMAPNGQVRGMDDETNGYVEMNERRQLFIYYDDEPEIAIGSFPDEAQYPLYLELAQGIEPGQRKRIAKAIAMYERRPDGAFAVHRYIERSGAAPQPGVELIRPADPRHRCYRKVLGRQDSPGQHHLLLADWRAICKCLDRAAAG